ncbi:MAG: glycosyltransferase family 2 protein [Candidatus Omnitrophica bacterium]|nr:glycosyltransferase family 2 protein [Candidatus Omnitrophota bacterium]
MKLCVLIPAYNVAATVKGLVGRVRAKGIETIAIDDGSSDMTADEARAGGAIVLKNEKNMGKGATLKRGFEYAINHGFEAVITMDGDGQHDPDDLDKFIDRTGSSAAGLIVGNRMCDAKDMPLIRVWTNQVMSWVISQVCKRKIPDTQCGYRLIKGDVLKRIDINFANYEIESEILIKAARAGFDIESVPIRTIYKDEGSRINPFVDTLRFIKFLFTV